MGSRLVNLKFPVRPEKISDLAKRFERLNLSESDFEEKFIRGSGKGGQKVNKSSNCVELVHQDSGIRITCHKDRSLILNRFLARRSLCEALENKSEDIVSPSELKNQKLKLKKQKKKQKSRKKVDLSQKKVD